MRILIALLILTSACVEPTDIGELCSADQQVVDNVLQPRFGENRIALDVSFERCFQFLCVSVNGNDPYCTQRCNRNEDCPDSFICEQPIEFGPLSRECADDSGTECEPAKYCVRADEWATVGELVPSGDAGP